MPRRLRPPLLHRLHRRLALIGALASLAALSASASLVAGPAGIADDDAPPRPRLEYLGQQIVPAGTPALGTRFGGISGLDYDAASGHYWAISDDRGRYAPARAYRLSLDLQRFTRSNEAGSDGVAIDRVVTLRRSDGSPFPDGTPDAEAIRVTPEGRLIWASEGSRGLFGHDNPMLVEMRSDGRLVRSFRLPEHYLPAPQRGVRDNRGFESLTLTPSGATVWVATENALLQDGPAATVSAGSDSRLLSFDRRSGRAGREYVYRIDPVMAEPLLPGLPAITGLVDILALDDQRFLMLERSFSVGPGWKARVYLASTEAATDVSRRPSIAGDADVRPMAKTLLLELSSVRNADGSRLAVDNIEALTLGPPVDGTPTLILVSDDNFSSFQFTQFIAFKLHGLDEVIGARPPRGR
ncbi:MAG: esterase-like activity of phytase family protein [Burkholderiaceae bacterium]